MNPFLEMFVLFAIGFFSAFALGTIWDFLCDAFSMCHDDYWF